MPPAKPADLPDMGLLDRLRNALQKPARPAGNPQLLAGLRAEAYRQLFGADPTRVAPHDVFQKPPFGGRVDILIYELPYERERGQVQVAVTSGLSDYLMVDRSAPEEPPRRRELIQYFRECRTGDIVRLHDMAWLPLAQGFCLDFFHTVGAHPGMQTAWPNAVFLPSLVQPHAKFKLHLDGEEMQFLWHVPLSEAELAFKTTEGLDALLDKMEAAELPWIFDENNRPSLV